ncbi:S-methyl-5-thioribose-1-phosphate isomerase [Thiofilum flexile]|uniref:S-methyl-5-thioribose-1-phosphate isomerase n=1 Tax=Thiofilum flexile TaxID=125627 RepID=UPI000369C840|nr:S-methyl-5-thioribose-1-phosphate isomerase [Thiofilum flexile]
MLNNVKNQHDSIRAVEWKNDHLILLDQRKLPHNEQYIELYSAEDVAEAIRNMVVRGAPAIGIAAAYALVLAARKSYKQYPNDWRNRLEIEKDILANARPTAVSLKWALKRMCDALLRIDGDPIATLLELAKTIHSRDIAANYQMGQLGAQLIDSAHGLITHGNTGSLATGGYGTALGVIRSAYADGKFERIYVGETRPWWQGSRLTAWELGKDHIPYKLVPDSAMAALMGTKRIAAVIVGADRIAANGDVANKIGTYSLAVNARYHGIKFIVVAPTSTIDLATLTGNDIPIEERSIDEVLQVGNQRIAAPGADAWNPSFDVTPAELIDVLVTEKGVIYHPSTEKLAQLMQA